MGLILDTCVASELARRNASLRVKEAVDALDPQTTFVSVITLGEIVAGIAQLDDGPKRSRLIEWFAQFETRFEGRMLAVDSDVVRHWGRLVGVGRRSGRAVSPTDGLIAATALHHGHVVMTRNVRHFEGTGVEIVNPWG